MNKVILILLLMCSFEIFSQPVTISIYGGGGTTVKLSDIFYTDGGGTSSEQTNLVQITLDYGKKEILIEPYFSIGYKFPMVLYTRIDRGFEYPVLSESGRYIDVGVKKTFVVGKADLCFLSGLGYNWDKYISKNNREKIEQIFKFNGLTYQIGMQMNFEFFNNIDFSMLWQFTIREKAESKGTINRVRYEFTGGGNYYSLFLGLSFNISEML